MLWLPESLSPERRADARRNPGTRFSFRLLGEALQRPCVGPLLQISLLYSLAFTLFQSNFALYAKTRLALDVQATSFVLTYVGILSVLVQGFAIGKLTARFRERRLIFTGTIVLALALLGWAFAPNVWTLLVVLAPTALAAGVLNTVLASQLTKVVRREETGGTLGLSASLQTFAQIVAPGLGGVLLENVGTWSIGVLGALIMAWTISFTRHKVLSQPDDTDASCHPGEVSATAA